MHGLIFMTWEKYLSERFGAPFLNTYREKIGESISRLPIANRLYDDETLLVGIGAAHELSQLPVDTLLHEYGRYFILNGLTSHLCMYILSDVHCGRDLLLNMRDAHARLRRTLDGLAPPLFEYGYTNKPDEVLLTYDSPRQLCVLLYGAIEGAAERYGETVQIDEVACMKRGDSSCRLRATFSPPKNETDFYKAPGYTTPERAGRQTQQKELMKQIWHGLPEAGTVNGLTMEELKNLLRRNKRAEENQLRPAVLLEALQQLQFAGYVMSTSTQVNDDFISRRYWRVHRHM